MTTQRDKDAEQERILSEWVKEHPNYKEEWYMFKNSVLKPNVNTTKWLKAAAVRAIKTVAQTAVASIGVSATMGEVNWAIVGSTALLSGIVSVLTSITGIPEVEEE